MSITKLISTLSLAVEVITMNKHIIAFVITMIAFTGVNETMAAAATQDYNNQTNFTSLDKQKIIVTWLETNKTKTDEAPVVNISNEDFWKIFEPLLKLSSNGSSSSSE